MCTLLFISTPDHHPIHASLIETDSKYEEMRGQIDFLNDAIEKLGQKMNTQLQSKNDELEQMKANLTAANSNAEQLSSSNSQLQQQCAYAYNSVCGKKFFINFSSMFSRKLMMRKFSSKFSHQFWSIFDELL